MIYRNYCEVELSRHAIVRARQRNIFMDMIEATIRGGTVEKFGKNYVRFSKYYKGGNVVCIGERKENNRIKIITIEWGCA